MDGFTQLFDKVARIISSPIADITESTEDWLHTSADQNVLAHSYRMISSRRYGNPSIITAGRYQQPPERKQLL